MSKLISILSLILALSAIQTFTAKGQFFGKHFHGWKLYEIKSFEMFNLKTDTLKTLRSIELNDDSVNLFLATARGIISSEQISWMGGYLITTLGPTIQKIEVSNYGGFFFDEKSSKYFQLSDEITSAFIDYLRRSYKLLSESTK